MENLLISIYVDSFITAWPCCDWTGSWIGWRMELQTLALQRVKILHNTSWWRILATAFHKTRLRKFPLGKHFLYEDVFLSRDEFMDITWWLHDTQMHYWPFVREFTSHQGIPFSQAVEQTIKLLVKNNRAALCSWDITTMPYLKAIAPITIYVQLVSLWFFYNNWDNL